MKLALKKEKIEGALLCQTFQTMSPNTLSWRNPRQIFSYVRHVTISHQRDCVSAKTCGRKMIMISRRSGTLHTHDCPTPLTLFQKQFRFKKIHLISTVNFQLHFILADSVLDFPPKQWHE